jgi:hypothetical protein
MFAMAGIGDLPDTIIGRSIILRMRRRAPSETVHPWRRRTYYDEGNAIRERLTAWARYRCLDHSTVTDYNEFLKQRGHFLEKREVGVLPWHLHYRRLAALFCPTNTDAE